MTLDTLKHCIRVTLEAYVDLHPDDMETLVGKLATFGEKYADQRAPKPGGADFRPIGEATAATVLPFKTGGAA